MKRELQGEYIRYFVGHVSASLFEAGHYSVAWEIDGLRFRCEVDRRVFWAQPDVSPEKFLAQILKPRA